MRLSKNMAGVYFHGKIRQSIKWMMTWGTRLSKARPALKKGDPLHGNSTAMEVLAKITDLFEAHEFDHLFRPKGAKFCTDLIFFGHR